MSAYQVIAKKFRPKKFSEVVGQNHIVVTLKNAIRLKRVAHAYLFTGGKGSGKTTLIRLFAKAINCHHLSEECEPCNECPSCLDITSSRSLDILEIDGASSRGIDDIRQINESTRYASVHGGFKIIMIDEVHMLTKEAFNALLKTLEEPPENVKFFFATTEPHKILPTILSRCQRFDLCRIPHMQIIQKLQKIGKELDAQIEDEAIHLIAKISDGSLRDAESLLDQALCFQEGAVSSETIIDMLGLLPLEVLEKIDAAYEKSDAEEFFVLAEEIYFKGVDLPYLFELLLEHYRTILIQLYQIPKEKGAFSLKEKELYQKSAKIYTKEATLRIIEYLTKLVFDAHKMPFRQLDVEMAFLYIMKQKHYISYEAAIEKLTEIEKTLSMQKTDLPLQEIALIPPLNPAPPKPKVERPAAAALKVPQEKPVEAPSPLPIEIKEEEPMPPVSPSTPEPVDRHQKHRLDNLMHFASVELKGKIKRA